MAFDAITTAELAVGKPITNELLEKFRNRDEFLNAQVGTLAAVSISNPSFEVTDTAASGGISNWTFTAFTGGGGTVDTSTSVHGTQSVKITHPGGAGNGGGYYESDFFAVSTLSGYIFEYAQNINGGAVPKGQVIRYTRGQSTIDEIDLPGSTVIGTTGQFEQFSAGFYPSSFITVKSSCAFIKLRLNGGTTDHSTAGTVNFDHVRVTETVNASAGNFRVLDSFATASLTTASTTVYAFKVRKSGGYKFHFTFTTVSGTPALRLYRNGTLMSTSAGLAGTTVSISNQNSTAPYRFKAGDEVVFSAVLSAGNIVNFDSVWVGVKNPMHGDIYLNSSSTAAT
jgi:hypothetical protein